MTAQTRTPQASGHIGQNTFELKRTVDNKALKLTVEEYQHPATGTVHLHLATDAPENVFMVALRTVPEDSTGVAHILEHTVLCGSERFPVRDPFFMMLRRSLNTFMNAFTSSDWTAYPFATQNRKDFDNLLEVYLDAVFFSRLDPLDFAQEGHRVEFAQADSADSELVYKGVVFNEMKGAMSSVSSILWDRLCYELFPTNTYHFNSGGDPEVIPDLSYQQLRDFYRTHYHPSNAIFLTFGDIPASEHQQKFEQYVLSRFERSEHRIEVSLEQPFSEPKRAAHQYAIESGDDSADKTHLIMGWKLGESADLTAMLEAQLLSAVLMENSASPLMKFLETTDLGSSPSPLCGVEESMREMVFCCGIEGSEVKHVDAFETQVMAVIESVVNTGVSAERLSSILHQIELHQREVSGDSMPYGLNLMLRALGAATHYGDAVAALDLDPVLATIRERVKDADYIPQLIRRALIDNPHRVTLTVSPDTTLSERRLASEKARLAALKTALDPQQQANIIDLTKALEARQAQVDDPTVLPRVELSDIPADIKEPSSAAVSLDTCTLHRYTTGTNGIVYQQLVARLPALTDSQLERLPMLTGLLPELGLGDQDYLAVQDRHSATVGSLSAGVLTRSAIDNEQDCKAYFVLSSKALANRSEAQVQLMRDTMLEGRFDELPRLRELVSQIRSRRDQSITGNGHSLAMNAATAGMSPLALRSHEQSGLEGIRRLRLLDDALDDDAALKAFGDSLADTYQALLSTPTLTLATIADEEAITEAQDLAANRLAPLGGHAVRADWKPQPIREIRRECWVTNTQVNFCARAYPTVAAGHPDAAALTVLAAFLRNGYLHRAIREQGGAYGGGASHDANIAAFRFYSYRDPRLTETLDDFDAAIDWLLSTHHEQLALEESILGIVGSLDKPASPAGEAKKHFHEQLFDRSIQHRRQFRQRVINTQLPDLMRVAQTYLNPENASTAVITNHHTAEANRTALEAIGLAWRELN